MFRNKRMRSQATAYPWTKGPLAVQQLFGSANALVSTTPFWGCEKDSRSTLTEAAATATAVSLLISISTIYRLVLYLKVCVPTFNLENGKSAEEMTMAEEPNSAENEEPMDSDKDDSDEFSDSDSSSGGYDSSGMFTCPSMALISYWIAFSLDLSCTEYDRISDETAANLNELEDCFVKLREAMKKEKLSSINSQIIQLLEEKSPDYLQPLEELIESRDERIQIAGVVRDYRIRNTKLNFEADLSITEQDFQVCSLSFIHAHVFLN